MDVGCLLLLSSTYLSFETRSVTDFTTQDFGLADHQVPRMPGSVRAVLGLQAFATLLSLFMWMLGISPLLTLAKRVLSHLCPCFCFKVI